MATTHGQLDKATIGPRKHLTITYPTPRETLLATPTVLPTSAPVSPQVSYTVGAGDLPVLDGVVASAITLVAFLFVGGANLAQTGQNISIDVFLNGVSVYGAPLVGLSSQPYYTQQCPIPIVLGDVLDVYLWTDNPDEVNFDYSALAIAPTRPHIAPHGTVVLGTHYLSFVQFPALTLGSPDWNNPKATNANNFDNNATVELFDDLTIQAQATDTEDTIYRVYYGDRNTATPFEDSYTRPFYDPNSVPTDITWYPTSIKVPL
jgi:hypothetical protein